MRIQNKLVTKWLAISGVVVFAVLVGSFAAKAYFDSQLFEEYVAELPTEYNTRESKELPGFRREIFTFEGASGSQVPVLAAYPTEKKGPFPCVIMLYGHNQKKEILDIYVKPFIENGFVLMIPDQYLRGERSVEDLSDFQDYIGLRRRAALNHVETRRLIDTIETRDDIDEDRIYLWGLSFGSMCSASIMAYEPRLKAAVFTVGAGDLNRMFKESSALDEIGVMKGPVSLLMASLLKPLEPTRYIGQISPRPVFFQNALQDQVIPRACAEALHNAADEPKTVTWYDVDHEGTDEENIVHIMTEGVHWLMEQETFNNE